MLTRVSNRSESRAARSSSCGVAVPGPRTRARVGRLRRRRRGRRSPRPLRTDRPSATMRWASRSIAAPSSRPSSARACPAESTPAATRRCDQRRQLQQPERVGDLRPGAADAGGQLLVRAAEVVEQLLVGGRLLERVQLAAVQVLQQGVAQQVVVVGVPDDRRDRRQAGLRVARQPPLAHDELVARRRRRPLGGDRPHDDRLQHADLADRVRPARRARPRRRPCAAAAGSGGSRRPAARRSGPGTGASRVRRDVACSAAPRRRRAAVRARATARRRRRVGRGGRSSPRRRPSALVGDAVGASARRPSGAVIAPSG